MDAEFQNELRKLQEAAGIKYGSGIYDQIGSTADKAEPKQKQAGVGTGVESDGVSEEVNHASNAACSTDVDADGYFPNTEHGTSIDSTGTAGAKMGDNPAQKSVKEKVDEAKLTESKRLVNTASNGNKVAKVYFDTDYSEFCVKLFVDGKYAGEDSNYFTDDKDDAVSTAKHMVSASSGLNEMRKLAGLAESETECDDECEITDEETDSKDVIKEAYSSFYHLLQEEFKKAKLK